MRQLRLLSILMFTLLGLALSPKVDLAQADFLGNCAFSLDYFGTFSGSYRPSDVIVRYEARNKRLLLVSWQTGEIVRELETSLSLSSSDVGVWDWSPHCRYLFGTANDRSDSVIWDVVNGGRAATTHLTPKYTYWNPDRDNLILEAHGGSYLWNFTQSDPILLTFSGKYQSTGYWYFNWEVVWDNQRNQVLVNPNYIDGTGVIAYDQASAQQIAFFDTASLYAPVKFALSRDNRHVIVFTSEDEAFASYSKTITVWDRDTMQAISVDAHSQSAVLPGQVALSPDGRYLVLARVGTLRVWDLANLAENLWARDPIHRYPIEATTRSVRFVSDTVVETTDLFNQIAQWDVVSGAPVS